jgi:hypothetical protein
MRRFAATGGGEGNYASMNTVYTTIPGAKCCAGSVVENRQHSVCARAERLAHLLALLPCTRALATAGIDTQHFVEQAEAGC